MEYSLRRFQLHYPQQEYCVLILILMEYSLRLYSEFYVVNDYTLS